MTGGGTLPARSVGSPRPGDAVVGDSDGVTVVPPFRAQELYEEVQARTVQENARMGMIRNGRTAADPVDLGGVPGRRVDTVRLGN